MPSRRPSLVSTLLVSVSLLHAATAGALGEEWTVQFGSDVGDAVLGAAAGTAGVFVAGYTEGALPGQSSRGGWDAFVCKYGPNSTQAWCRQFGTPDGDLARAVTLRGAELYVAGQTYGTFPGEISAGGADAFVCKVDPSGAIFWCRQFGSDIGDVANGVAADRSGVYVAGSTDGALAGQTSLGGSDAFLCKYDPAGNLAWCRQFGSDVNDVARGVATDRSGVYVTGSTDGTLAGQASLGASDAFLCKYDPSGTLLWCLQFGTDSSDSAHGVATTAAGVYVAGQTFGAFAGYTNAGESDAFLCQYDSAGVLSWCDQFGSTSWDGATSVAAEGASAYVGGLTDGALPGQTSAGASDAFACKYDAAGFQAWCRQFGTESEDDGYGVAANSVGAYVVGSTDGAFPDQVNLGAFDAFVAKLTP